MTIAIEVDKFQSVLNDNYLASVDKGWSKYVQFRTVPRYYNKVEIGDRILVNNPDYPPAFYIVTDKRWNLTLVCKHEFDAIGFRPDVLTTKAAWKEISKDWIRRMGGIVNETETS